MLQAGSERPRFICSLCGSQVFHIGIHLQQKHGFKDRTDSDEYRQLKMDCKRADPNATTDSVSLDDMLEDFRRFLRSMAGGDKDEQVADTMVRQVRRILEELLDGEPYRPQLLLRLKDIGNVPDGMLHKYSVGQSRDKKRRGPSTLGVYVTYLIHFVRFLKREPVHLQGILSKDQLDQVNTGSMAQCLSVTVLYDFLCLSVAVFYTVVCL